MHNLFGDRFLKLFAGDLQRRPKQTFSDVKDKNTESKAEDAEKSVDLASEDGHDNNLDASTDFPNEKN